MANLSIILFESISHPPVDATQLVLPLASAKTKGCGYFNNVIGLHTVFFSTVSGFVGEIVIQATLAADPADADWFDVDGIVLGDGISILPDDTVSMNFTGNFVWVRGLIRQFTAGEINRVLFAHS